MEKTLDEFISDEKQSNNDNHEAKPTSRKRSRAESTKMDEWSSTPQTCEFTSSGKPSPYFSTKFNNFRMFYLKI